MILFRKQLQHAKHKYGETTRQGRLIEKFQREEIKVFEKCECYSVKLFSASVAMFTFLRNL